MIRFEQEDDGPELFLVYTPETNDGKWLRHQLDTTGKASLSGKIFHVTKARLIESGKDADEVEFVFRVGTLASSYYCIDQEVLGLNFDLAIHVTVNLERKIFAAERNISIFRRFNDFGLESLAIGGDEEEALPAEVFGQLLTKFPNTTELDHYAKARISAIVRNYLPLAVDPQSNYVRYMRKRESLVGAQPRITFAELEAEKFEGLIAKIEMMLDNTVPYNETQWQMEILQVIQFLYPKYIKAFREAPVRDSLANKNRSIDFLLIDASGYVDAIEIKQPFAECIVTSNRYRDNHVPMRELTGTIMQLEKYLYHLNRWGEAGEKKLNERYSEQLPEGMELKIVNPSGMIIMGRDQNLTSEQRTDFEVIRRKYRHVVEIMTYDDLLRRLKVIREQFFKEIKK